MIIIGIRDDLDMPLGKEASQCAHALCALVLGFRDFSMDVWRLPVETIMKEISSMKIQRLAAERFKDALITIHDAGHTVFNGVPTLTTCAIVSDDISPFYKENPHVNGGPTDTRMTLCVRKSGRKALGGRLPFLCEATKSYAFHLVSLIQKNDLTIENRNFFHQWASGSFAKITLSAEDSFSPDFGELPYTDCPHGMTAIGPAPKEILDTFTKPLRLL